MALKLPDHSHCDNCGDPTPLGENHCSEECRVSAAKEKAGEKRSEYITYLSLGVILVAVIVIGYLI